ncbi:Lsr2 family protein [Quadrisphaera sp. DSM 44207]|uniref:histone-like nucleoid-structuring protein Lsr2 n=1 Tax=Quadrisphaera sp. DSM 44207 TaxID=1881057 RepID=UPI000880D22C|nr:Lsr2 family protein [Quadrisphaera sp. DSM 44207]SDQ16586.1 Lsr2 protein [Quadrisphaera sp. DSM 44207]
MAQKMQVLLIDDLDGGDAAETVSFSLDGVAYEVDLNEENAAKLRDALAPWVGHARKVGGAGRGGSRRGGGSGGSGGSGRSGRSGSGSGGDTAEIRAWARENGHTVSERGRIPTSVIEAYRAANS